MQGLAADGVLLTASEPLQGLLDGHDGSLGVKCDIATRISRRGALTWWHLDDGGEFVLQVADAHH